MRTLLTIFIALALAAPAAQPVPGCTVAGADLPTALAVAQANPARCLDIPAGEWAITATAGEWLSMTADRLTVRGQGQGVTVLRLSPTALTGNLYPIRLRGQGQTVEALTIQIDPGSTGAYEVGAISIYTEASRATVRNVEIVGGHSGTGGGGFGIGTYRAWTANGGAQYNLIADNWIHDTETTGIVINSNGNTIRGNLIQRVGNSNLRHGIYAQGGGNLYESNTVEGASGWSFHAWKKVPNLDSSNDRWIGNVSTNPGFQHMIISGTTANGAPLNRMTIVQGNTFQQTDGRQTDGLVSDNPALIEGNIFECVGKVGGLVISVPGRSVVSGNSITGGLGGVAIRGTDATIISNNQLVVTGPMTAIGVQGVGGSVLGNTISLAHTGSQGITVSGRDHWIDGNSIEVSATYAALGLLPNTTGLHITNNRLTHSTPGAMLANFGNLATRGITGAFIGNRIVGGYVRYDGGSALFAIRDNSGQIVAYGTTGESYATP